MYWCSVYGSANEYEMVYNVFCPGVKIIKRHNLNLINKVYFLKQTYKRNATKCQLGHSLNFDFRWGNFVLFIIPREQSRIYQLVINIYHATLAVTNPRVKFETVQDFPLINRRKQEAQGARSALKALKPIEVYNLNI